MKMLLFSLAVLCLAAPSTVAVQLQEILKDNTMQGWEEKSQDNENVTRKTWEIKDNILHCTGKSGGGWWGSGRDYTDFIIEFDFKIPPEGNSGVYLRTPKEGHPSFVGMEVQILDDYAPVYKDILPGQFCGSVYKIAPPKKQVLKKAGEWNHMRITADADHITVEMNGETIVDADGKSAPEILKRSKSGPVGFQNHSSELWFRNIKFADLAADRAERTRWFRDAKFGMFIHWGVYSVLGEGEWIMKQRKIKAADYEKLPPQFDAADFDPNAWAALARRAGCKYVVITSKHHDGFAMFDSKVSDYDVVEKTPYRKDPLRQLADAVRKEGLHFGFYHSILDWHHPDYLPVPNWDAEARASHKPDFDKYLEYMQGQVRELCTNYGPLCCIWWDGGWDHKSADDKPKLAKINAMIRELQPAIMINNRAGLPEDFDTPEQYIPPTGITNADGTPKLWENCITLTTGHGSHPPTAWWGYDKNEKEFKTPEYCVRMLVDVVSKGGNLLLNVGPDPHGRIGPNETKTLEAMGKWLDANGEAIYGTTASPFTYLPFHGRATVKGDKLYVHVFTWPADHRIVIPGLKNEVKSARRLDSSIPLDARRVGGDWVIVQPAPPLDPFATVIALQLHGPPVVEPYVTRAGADGVIELLALGAELRGRHGQRIRLDSRGNQVFVSNWTNPHDEVAWVFDAGKGGAYEVVLSYSAEQAAPIVAVAGDTKLEGKINPTPAKEFNNLSLGKLQLPAGVTTLILQRSEEPKGAAVMKLKQVTLRPAN